MEEDQRENVDKLIDEYLRRAYKSFIEHKSCASSNIIFKCPDCGSNYLELKQEAFRKQAILDCLWVNCFFTLKVPPDEELEDFLKRKEGIHRLFQKL